MKRPNSETSPELVRDVEELVHETTVTEAVTEVETRFESAWENLDNDSASLLGEFFDGKTVSQISRERNLSEAEVEALLKRSKRELVQSLRANFQTRH